MEDPHPRRELVYVVDHAIAQKAQPITLAEAGLKERSHLQEWVIAHPQILGARVLIVTAELGRWISLSGTKEADRLDVLGLDADGQLVVAELKRGAAPDTVDMQAIKYAAMAGGFDIDELAHQHSDFLKTRKQPTTAEEARSSLIEHASHAIEV